MAADQSDLKNPNYELFILAISTLSLANLVVLVMNPLSDTASVVRTVDIGLSGLLLLDFCYRLLSAPSKRRYFIRDYGWLDFIGSSPLPFLRLARLYRMISVTLVLQPVRKRLWLTMWRDRAGTTLYAVLFLAIVLLEVASAAVLAIEHPTPGANIMNASDALWWTWVSITTVGYGDYYPVTNAGRLVGVITLAVGVGLYGAITGFLANVFLRPTAQMEREARDREERFRAELDAIRLELRAVRSGQDATPDRPSQPPQEPPSGGARPFDRRT